MAEFGPRPIIEVFLALSENGEVFYQFNGMDGQPPDHNLAVNLMQHMIKAMTAPQISNVTEIRPNESTTLYPQGVSA